MTKTCDTCANWKRPEQRDGFGSAIYLRDGSEEQDAAVDTLFGECQQIVLLYRGLEVGDPIPIATVRDGSDYSAILYTQAEFGCSLHATAR